MKKITILFLCIFLLALSSHRAEAFGGTVDWDGNTQTASIAMGGTAATPPPATITPPPTTQPPSGSIDNRILGGWSYLIGTNFYAYQFSSDGTFLMINTSSLTSVEGTFYTTNGTVYLKNLVSEYRDTTKQLADQESTYSFGSDDYGEYLMIKTFKTSDTVSESEPIHKFRRQ
jgi:hypothetical protein